MKRDGGGPTLAADSRSAADYIGNQPSLLSLMSVSTLSTTDQLAAWRADTPGCAHRNHLNNAGAALMPQPVIDAITEHVTLESEIGGYEAADTRADQEIQAAMRTGIEMVVETRSGQGLLVRDHYPLRGAATAMDAAAIACVRRR